ncbi:putative nuclease HARBI1 [Heptranchias perlo]|uniref:putative nuclease HARBI1 n=1 Tax=Heptranchias perlo TaxID=212740 RepID=UPI00355A5DA2
MSHQVVADICSLLHAELLSAGPGSISLPIAVKVTATLNFFTSGSSQDATGDIAGISQSSAYKCIRQVIDGLFRRALQYVNFPNDEFSQTERTVGFHSMVGFPCVQGAIDCTHIAIRSPPHEPGLCHDSFILRESNILGLFHTLNTLGDKGYPLHTWLMTPLSNTISQQQRRYNDSHITTRSIIEHAIGLLKMRFWCLDRSGGALQYAARVGRTIVVCFILHNMVQQRGLQVEEAPSTHPPSTSAIHIEKDQEEEEEKEEEEADETMDRAAAHQAAREAGGSLICERFS